jgi:hypothetical protein
MTRAEAMRAVWSHVAAGLRSDLDARAGALTRAIPEETALLRAAAESVRRAASRLSKPTKQQRRGGP